jgi:hypothetical protein
MYLDIKRWKIDMEKLLEWLVTAKDWKYVIKEEKKIRTTPQNRYLRWCVYKTIADKMGETDLDYIHWIMGLEFILDRTKKKPYPRSTTSLTTAEMVEYIENIKNRVSQYWIIIPSAEEYHQLLDE